MVRYGNDHTRTDGQSELTAMVWADTHDIDVLTVEEVNAARQATSFDTGLWGHPEHGWTPEALVAQRRGVVFQPDAYGFYHPDNLAAAQQALEDVASFLGFLDIDTYLNTVMREQQAIVSRFC
jgi:hypothetical protein